MNRYSSNYLTAVRTSPPLWASSQHTLILINQWFITYCEHHILSKIDFAMYNHSFYVHSKLSKYALFDFIVNK